MSSISLTKSSNMDINDSMMLLIDHQSGLFNTVRDMEVPDLRRNVTALARAGTLAGIPILTTSSMPDGPNGPLIPEIEKEAPKARYIPRHGEINAWDMPEFVKAVEESGRKTLIIAGTLTDVCLAFPAVTAVKLGYKVYAVVDASGSWSTTSYELACHRMVQAGVILIDTFAMISELMITHARPDVLEWYSAFCLAVPRYQLLIESYTRAQEVAKSAPK
jgi:nicotinamidase-related amidase